MKKILFLTALSLAIIFGTLIGEYFINSRFLEVETLKVSRTSVNNYTSADGEVKDGGRREITSELPFTVKKLYVSQGDKVSAGQRLADIDYSKILTKFQLAAAELSDKEGYNNLIELTKNKPNYIEAPIDGIISSVNCTEGNDFSQDIPAFIITDIENLTVRIKINTEKLNEIYVGQKAYIYQNNNVTEGQVSKIYPLSDNTSNESLNTVTADIIPITKNSLVFGLKAEVKLVDEPYENIILVPFDAIMYDDNAPYIYINSSGYAVKRYVITGKEFETDAEIVSGLDTDDKIILNPRKLKITEGDKIMEN